MPTERETLLASEIERVDGVAPAQGIEKHKKMASSPFVFFRGSAQLFYADLAKGVIKLPDPLLKLPLTNIMGDCHTANFGFITEEGSHSGSVIFCPNDFDDACIGHASWDLLRYATSLFLCQQHCAQYVSEHGVEQSAASSASVNSAIKCFLEGYLEICQLGANDQLHVDQALSSFEGQALMEKAYTKALKRAKGGKQFLTKSALAKSVDLTTSPPAFLNNTEKFRVLPKARYRALLNAFEPYMDDAVLDIVERLGAGTGSVNMQRYYFLVGPKDMETQEDLALCHIVEVKQQRQAAPIYYFPDLSPANRLPPAHLTQVCQKRMQRRPDLVLDEAIWQRKHWLIRSRHHARVGFDPEDVALGKAKKVDTHFIQYAHNCGKALGLAHCRGDRRSIHFETSILNTLPNAETWLIEKAESCAWQVKQDQQWLFNWI